MEKGLHGPSDGDPATVVFCISDLTNSRCSNQRGRRGMLFEKTGNTGTPPRVLAVDAKDLRPIFSYKRTARLIECTRYDSMPAAVKARSWRRKHSRAQPSKKAATPPHSPFCEPRGGAHPR